VFVICTHSIDEATCEALKARHFTNVKATELKHSRLAKSPRQAKMLIAALEDLATNHGDRILVGMSDKRYSLLAKIVDLVIETSMHRAGFNLYKDGGNLAMTNVMYACMDLDPPYLNRVLGAFQRWMRERSFQRRFELGWTLSQSHPIEPIDEFRITILGALKHLGYTGVIAGLPMGVLDLSFSTAINLMGLWRAKLGDDPIELVHDQSSNMAKQQQLWDVLVSPTAPSALVGHDSRTMRFPLGVTGTQFVDGRTSAALQIADIVAGATAAIAGSAPSGIQNDYIAQLGALFERASFNGYQFQPSLDFTPETLGTVGAGGKDPLEYTGKLMQAAGLIPT
jgi:hypothetical protein